MDMYEMLGLVLIYMYNGYGLRNTQLIFNCKQMNIIDLSVSKTLLARYQKNLCTDQAFRAVIIGFCCMCTNGKFKNLEEIPALSCLSLRDVK